MRALSLLFSALLLLVALPVAGDEIEPNTSSAPCTLTGTWLGGSDPATPYLMTTIPSGAGRYTAIFQLAIPAVFEPYLGITTWSGEVVRVEPERYEFWLTMFAVWDPVWAAANGVDPSLPELHFVHGLIEFTDCNALAVKIDLYDGFVNFDYSAGMKPFVTPPDWSALTGGATIDEVYYRMPSVDLRPAVHSRELFGQGAPTLPVVSKRLR
jgi:hypothetical protein